MQALFEQGDLRDKIVLAESIAGDKPSGMPGLCGVVEALTDIVPASLKTRMIALELERVAMHLSVLSALAGDVAYLLGQNLLAALRTVVINSSLAICGSRFGKRWLCPGGVNYGISKAQKEVLETVLKDAEKRIKLSLEAMLSEPSVLSRFDDTGRLSQTECRDFGFTGITAKAADWLWMPGRIFRYILFRSFPSALKTAEMSMPAPGCDIRKSCNPLS